MVEWLQKLAPVEAHMRLADLRLFGASIDLDVVTFPEEIVERDYHIPLRNLSRRLPTGTAVLCRLLPGWTFLPRASSHLVQVVILRGDGDFYLDETYHTYGVGNVFVVRPGQLYAFLFVNAETYFLKYTPPRGSVK